MCVNVTAFTRRLSRSASGVEHPLTLSRTQRNTSARYLALGSGDEGEVVSKVAERTEDSAKVAKDQYVCI